MKQLKMEYADSTLDCDIYNMHNFVKQPLNEAARVEALEKCLTSYFF